MCGVLTLGRFTSQVCPHLLWNSKFMYSPSNPWACHWLGVELDAGLEEEHSTHGEATGLKGQIQLRRDSPRPKPMGVSEWEFKFITHIFN